MNEEKGPGKLGQDQQVTSEDSNSNPEDPSDEPVAGSSCTLANRTRTFSKNCEESISSIGESISSDQMADSITEDPDWVTIPPVGQSRSDFFVFCSECADLREGKLRVRCSKCLSGAFTVHRHPQGWEDVLIPSQVFSDFSFIICSFQIFFQTTFKLKACNFA